MGTTKTDVIHRAYDAFASGDLPALTELLADDLVVHVPPGLPISGDHRGRDAFLGDVLGRVMAIVGAPPRLELHDVTESADHAVGLYTIHIERDGHSYSWPHVNVYHVSDGKIREFWWTPFDVATVRAALG